MLVGIYMPQGPAQEQAPRAVDQLETEFFRRALGALGRISPETRFVWFSETDMSPPCDNVSVCVVSRRASLLNPWRDKTPTLDQALQQQRVEVLLTTIDAPPARTTAPVVLFTLDMTFREDNGSAAISKSIKRACGEARIILCPSVYVHKSCASQFEMGLEKAVVARAGVEELFGQRQASIVDGRYALFILNRYTWPHIATITEAIRRNPDLFPPTLVVLGPLYPDEPETWGLPLIRVERCPDAMTAALMQHADMVLYPAAGDGSGMTVLQAMRAGARLIASKSGAVFELAGATPFYCEPDNAISLLQVMRRLLDETPDEYEKRRQMARSLVLDCTWERCGKKILSAVKRSLLQ